MTNELEKQFFDTFGVEPKPIYSGSKLYNPFVTGYDYPTITDRILLKLLCLCPDLDNVFFTDVEKLKETLLNKVKFIWYESTDEDPIRVFTRLNIGKIPLTDAELIKALFLNQSNFSHGENTENIRLYQQEIAAEWDNIEYTLQNDEFWLFIHSLGWDKPTRIDFIFDLMRKKECFGKIEEKCIGEDEHKSFRYFYEYFKAKKKTIDGSKLRDEIWRKVKEYFQIFQEWYNDLELYHYVGYLVDRGDISTLQTLLCKWIEKSSKDSFEDYLIDQIKGKLNKCSDLTRKYGDTGENKTECLPLLLLFVLILNVLPKVESYKSGIIFFIISAIFVVMMIINVSETQKTRRRIDKGRASERTIKNYQGSEQYLDSLGVSKEAKILSLWSYPQNTPFILMNRKGFTEMWDRKEGVDAKMSFDFDYLIVENELYEKEKHTWKYVFDDLEYYSDNGKIMIFVKKENDNVNKN